MANSPCNSPFASPNLYRNLPGIGSTSTGWQKSAVISPRSRPQSVLLPHGNMTNRTEQVSIRQNADGFINRVPFRGRSRPGTLPADAEELFFPAGYFSTPFKPLPVAYYRQESQNDGEDILSELKDALADMRIRIAEDMGQAEFKVQDNSETLCDAWEEGLEKIPLVKDNSTGLLNDEESRIQGDELTDDNSTAPLPNEESESRNMTPLKKITQY